MTGQMTDHVIVTDDGPIRILRLNRPDKKNALTDAMYEMLSEALENAAVSKSIRCVVIAGGPGAFTAGAAPPALSPGPPPHVVSPPPPPAPLPPPPPPTTAPRRP